MVRKEPRAFATPSALSISVQTADTPNCWTILRKGGSVIPAIGARKTFPASSRFPIFIRRPLPLPQGEVLLLGSGNGKAPRRHIPSDRAPRAHNASFSYLDRGNKLDIRTYKASITNSGEMLLFAVIVAGNGPASDVHVNTYLAVAKIGEVRGF